MHCFAPCSVCNVWVYIIQLYIGHKCAEAVCNLTPLTTLERITQSSQRPANPVQPNYSASYHIQTPAEIRIHYCLWTQHREGEAINCSSVQHLIRLWPRKNGFTGALIEFIINAEASESDIYYKLCLQFRERLSSGILLLWMESVSSSSCFVDEKYSIYCLFRVKRDREWAVDSGGK